VSFGEIAGSGVWIDGYFLQTNPVTVTEECEKTFRDTVFANITGGSDVYALYIYHSGSVVTVDRSMFCDIHLDQSFVTVYIRDTKFFALLLSCFYRLTTRDYTSFAISYDGGVCNQVVIVNQTSEANTGGGVTMAGQYCCCREKLVYISNNISHVSVSAYHQGITVGPVPANSYMVTMSQVVETGTGAFIHIYLLSYPILFSNLNLIDNNPVTPNGCFQNNGANDAMLKSCIFSMKESSVWFGSLYASQCKFYLVDCYFTGCIPPEHSYVDTSGLITTDTISTVIVRRIGEGICKGGSKDFTSQAEHAMNYFVICSLLFVV